MRYINPHFTYLLLLTYLHKTSVSWPAQSNLHSFSQSNQNYRQCKNIYLHAQQF